MQAKNIEATIQTSDTFDSSIIPAAIHYAYVLSDDTTKESNMGQEELNNAIAYENGQYRPSSLDDCYLVIKRGDGACILHYYVRSQYTITWMNRYVLSPDLLMMLITVIGCLISCLTTTTAFARYLKKQLQPLMDATQEIKQQNLDFEIYTSKIKEFNDILISINDMKFELKQSMEQQWQLEQAKKEQTSALAHDIKTPLTIIRGNTELLKDTTLTAEQQEYTNYILKNENRMEQYLNILIALTKSNMDYPVHICEIEMQPFLEELQEQSNGLALSKQIKIEFTKKNLPSGLNADKELLHRAILNVISNAIDYAPEHGKIHVTAEMNDHMTHFIITDNGPGFSNIDLKQAQSQFYMGDASRSQSFHYGIGLYIADSIVKQHHGSLHIGNSSITGGGEVFIEIPTA
jgi:signal transduction histidine kinase